MSKGVNFNKMADFHELEELGNRIAMAVALDDRSSKFNREEIIKAASNKQMEYLLKEAPLGKNGSNWYYWFYPPGGGNLGGPHSASYPLQGRAHKAGTYARGWVSDMPEGGAGRKPGKDAGKQKVDLTPIKKTANNLTMLFYNTAPYAWAIERGHLVRMPWFFGTTPEERKPGCGPITGFVPGKWCTMKAVFHAEDDVKKAVAREMSKQLKQVVKKK